MPASFLLLCLRGSFCHFLLYTTLLSPTLFVWFKWSVGCFVIKWFVCKNILPDFIFTIWAKMNAHDHYTRWGLLGIPFQNHGY